MNDKDGLLFSLLFIMAIFIVILVAQTRFIRDDIRDLKNTATLLRK